MRIADKALTVKVFAVHINAADLPVIISGVIINTAVGVTAGGIDRADKTPVLQQHASVGLFHRTKYMEKLADAFFCGKNGRRVQLHKGCARKP